MTDAPVLQARGLGKSYGGVQALVDADLDVVPGEVVAIVGENGAGKSTMVKILCGVIRADTGWVEVDGHRQDFTAPRDAHAVGIRLAPQELQLAVDVSVTENLLMGQLPSRGAGGVVDWPAARELARERLAALGITHVDVELPVSRLSVVERAFVQIARATNEDARVLVLDEPTAPMDDREVTQLLRVLAEVTASGVAVLYISHRLQEVFEVCDRAVVLRDGRVVARLDGDDMQADRLVDAMVSGRLKAFRRPGVDGTDATDAPAALRATGVRGVDALRLDELRVEVGEVVSVYGTLGSGREELAPTLMGLRGDVGHLEVQGERLASTATPSVIAAGVGYVPAERRSEGLVLERSVRENLTLGMLDQLSTRSVLDRGEEDRVVQHWIDALAIATASPELPVQALSGGSQQKVLLARWLAAGSTVLVLEEPTRGVDVATKAEIYRVLHDHAARGGAVLIVSSDVEEVARVSHRVLVLRDGSPAGELRDADESEIASLAMAA